MIIFPSLFFSPMKGFCYMNGNMRPRFPFSKQEDQALRELVKKYGENDWSLITSYMPNRTVRQCRERWFNSLSDRVIKRQWTKTEDAMLLSKYSIIGPHWKLMEKFFIGRTMYDLRNRYHSLQKKLSSKFEYVTNRTFNISNPNLNTNVANNTLQEASKPTQIEDKSSTTTNNMDMIDDFFDTNMNDDFFNGLDLNWDDLIDFNTCVE